MKKDMQQETYGIDIVKAQQVSLVKVKKIENQNQQTLSYDVKDILQNKFNISYDLNTKYIGYNSNYDCIEDEGWGCAWRSIQILLSSFQVNPESFDILFYKFGTLSFIQHSYMKKNNLQDCPQYLQEWKGSPVNLENGWAEPFICYCILNYYQKQCQLFKVNQMNINMYAPKECFKNVISSEKFMEILIEHFQEGNKTPIMIDDGIVAKVILYATKLNNNIEIIFADPHIKSNSTSNQELLGIYKSIYNNKGKFISKQLKEEDYNNYYINPNHTHDCFETLSWMVCIIN